MNFIDDVFKQELAKAKAAEKQSSLLDASIQKRNRLSPNWQSYDQNAVMDADTLNGEPLGLGDQSTDNVRLAVAGGGYHPNAYESDPRIYEENPAYFRKHAKNFSETRGIPLEDVTPEQLVNVGLNAKEMNTGGEYNLLGEQGHYGRQLGEMRDAQGQDLGRRFSQRDQNADYWNQNNWRQIRDDRMNNGLIDHEYNRKRDRTTGEKTADAALALGKGVVGVGEGLGWLGQKGVEHSPIGAGARLLGMDESPQEKGLKWGTEKLGQLREYLDTKLSDPAKIRNEQHRRRVADHSAGNERRYKQRIDSGMSPLAARSMEVLDGALASIKSGVVDPSYAAEAVIEAIPSMLPVAGAGKVGQLRGLAKIARIEKAGGILTKEAKAKLIQRTAQAYSLPAVALVEGSSNALDTRKSLEKLTPEYLLENNPAMGDLVKQGHSPEEAKEILINNAEEKTFVMSGLAAGIISKFSGALEWESKLFGSAAGEILGEGAEGVAQKLSAKLGATGAKKVGLDVAEGITRAAAPAAAAGGKEAVEEGLQGGTGGFFGNLSKSEVNPEQDVWEGVGEQAGEGILAGAGMGAGIQGAKDIGSGIAKGTRLIRTNALPPEAAGAGNTRTAIDEATTQEATNISPEDAENGTISVDPPANNSLTAEQYRDVSDDEFRGQPGEAITALKAIKARQAELMAQGLSIKNDSNLSDSEKKAQIAPIKEEIMNFNEDQRRIQAAVSAPEQRAVSERIGSALEEQSNDPTAAGIDLSPEEKHAVFQSLLSGAMEPDQVEAAIQVKLQDTPANRDFKTRLKLFQKVNQLINAEGHSPKVKQILAEKYGYFSETLTTDPAKPKLGLMGHMDRINNLMNTALQSGKSGTTTNALKSLSVFADSQNRKLAEEEAKQGTDRNERRIAAYKKEQAILDDVTDGLIDNYNNNILPELRERQKEAGVKPADMYQKFNKDVRLQELSRRKAKNQQSTSNNQQQGPSPSTNQTQQPRSSGDAHTDTVRRFQSANPKPIELTDSGKISRVNNDGRYHTTVSNGKTKIVGVKDSNGNWLGVAPPKMPKTQVTAAPRNLTGQTYSSRAIAEKKLKAFPKDMQQSAQIRQYQMVGDDGSVRDSFYIYGAEAAPKILSNSEVKGLKDNANGQVYRSKDVAQARYDSLSPEAKKRSKVVPFLSRSADGTLQHAYYIQGPQTAPPATNTESGTGQGTGSNNQTPPGKPTARKTTIGETIKENAFDSLERNEAEARKKLESIPESIRDQYSIERVNITDTSNPTADRFFVKGPKFKIEKLFVNGLDRFINARGNALTQKEFRDLPTELKEEIKTAFGQPKATDAHRAFKAEIERRRKKAPAQQEETPAAPPATDTFEQDVTTSFNKWTADGTIDQSQQQQLEKTIARELKVKDQADKDKISKIVTDLFKKGRKPANNDVELDDADLVDPNANEDENLVDPTANEDVAVNEEAEAPKPKKPAPAPTSAPATAPAAETVTTQDQALADSTMTVTLQNGKQTETVIAADAMAAIDTTLSEVDAMLASLDQGICQ